MAHKPYSQANTKRPASSGRFPLAVAALALVLVAVGAFFLFNRGTSAPAKPAEVAGRPQLAVDREQIDFGKVPLDVPVQAKFELRNTGDQVLQIQGAPQVEVREGC